MAFLLLERQAIFAWASPSLCDKLSRRTRSSFTLEMSEITIFNLILFILFYFIGRLVNRFIVWFVIYWFVCLLVWFDYLFIILIEIEMEIKKRKEEKKRKYSFCNSWKHIVNNFSQVLKSVKYLVIRLRRSEIVIFDWKLLKKSEKNEKASDKYTRHRINVVVHSFFAQTNVVWNKKKVCKKKIIYEKSSKYSNKKIFFFYFFLTLQKGDNKNALDFCRAC